MKYIKELDAVRAVAVLLVVISHWITIRNPFVSKLIHYFGPIGVDIFFVLSGFLITWILFENYKKVEEGEATKGSVLKSFYVRRSLRIFPIYYLVIIILLLVKDSTGTQIGETYPYYFTYTSNFLFYSKGEFDGILSHLWSLAVEEQFYLIWPGLILLVKRKFLPHLILIFISIGIISQLAMHANLMASVLPFTCFDSFGLGALLAWYLVYNPAQLNVFYKYTKIGAMIAAPLFVVGLLQNHWPVMPMVRTLISVITVFVITYIIIQKREGKKLSLNFFWNNPALVYIGKISYGIYLYHNIIPHYTSKALDNFFHVNAENMLPHKMGYVVMLGINAALLISIASLSWFIIEKPILALKKHFNYK